MADLSTQYIQSLRDRVDDFNFKKEQQEYQDLLSQYNPPPENYDIYDFATSISQGLLAQQQTGRPHSVGGGLALGFNQASQDMKQRKEAYAKSRREIGLEATRIAIQNEQEATKFLDESLFELAKASMEASMGVGKQTADITNYEYWKNLPTKEAKEDWLQMKGQDPVAAYLLALEKARGTREGGAPGGIDLSVVEKKMDEEFAKMIVEYIYKDKPQVTENLRNLSEKIEILKAGSQNVSGPFIGILGDRAKGIFTPEAASFLGDIRDVVFQSLREKLGAQFTEREGDRLVAAAFNPLLPEAMNIARLKRLYITIEEAARAKEEGLTYFNENGTIKGYEAKVLDFDSIMNSIVLSSDYEGMTNEELEKSFEEGDETEKNAILNLLRQQEAE